MDAKVLQNHLLESLKQPSRGLNQHDDFKSPHDDDSSDHNDDNFSGADFIAYTAFTIVPRAEIIRPSIDTDILSMGPGITVTWDGIDPDSPDPQKRPVGFLHRLLRLDTLEPSVPLSQVTSPAILFSKGDLIWTYQDAETTSLTLNLGTFFFFLDEFTLERFCAFGFGFGNFFFTGAFFP